MLGASALQALGYFFVTRTLHTSPAVYGLVGPAFGVGSVAGALLAGRFVPRIGAARAFAGSTVAVGCALVLLSRQASVVPALAVWVALGTINAGSNVALMPLLLKATPRNLVGRMNALFLSAIGAVALCSSALAGWLASVVLLPLSVEALGMHFGAVDTLLLAGGVLICLGGIYAARGLRKPVRDIVSDRA